MSKTQVWAGLASSEASVHGVLTAVSCCLFPWLSVCAHVCLSVCLPALQDPVRASLYLNHR